MSEIIRRSQTHATFVVERTYPVAVKALWHALSDNQARDQWFGGGPEFDAHQRSHDFRVGCRGIEEGQWQGGPRSRFVSTYTDIVDQQRIVFAYDMWLDDRHITTSLTTITMEPAGDETHLTYTEQGVHLDGLDSVEGRQAGTHGLLDNLGSFVRASTESVAPTRSKMATAPAARAAGLSRCLPPGGRQTGIGRRAPMTRRARGRSVASSPTAGVGALGRGSDP